LSSGERLKVPSEPIGCWKIRIHSSSALAHIG
jgi:hypothetical protein